VIDLVKTFQQVLERVRTRPVLNVDEETVTVGQMIIICGGGFAGRCPIG